MYVRVYVYVKMLRVCVSVCMYVIVCEFGVHVCMSRYVRMCVCDSACAYVYVGMFVSCIYVSVYMSVYVCECESVYMSVYCECVSVCM